MASLGAKVLQVRSVELAMVHKVRTYVRSSFDDPGPTRKPGTLICDEEEIVEQQVVTGIAYSKDEAQITLRHVADKPGVAAAIFVPLAEANINVDMIIQNISDDGATTDITFTVPHGRLRARPRRSSRRQRGAIGYATRRRARPTSPRSRRSASACAAMPASRPRAFKALAEKGINIRAITTSEIKILGPDRRRLYRACGADAAFAIRPRQGLT